MFSNVVAYIGFIGTSVIFAAIVLDAIVNRKHNEWNKIINRAQGIRTTYWNAKVAIFVAIWFISGVYLWG